ncbi:hypothetical protein Q3A66_19095 [Hymenobacter sp. BT770]|nr:hypothetical protein [Hymenobacter sp. BT770]MDO3417180.1 hypothetical protein [Hymenobacter sp. BT770]
MPAARQEELALMRAALEAQDSSVRQVAYCATCDQYAVLGGCESF